MDRTLNSFKKSKVIEAKNKYNNISKVWDFTKSINCIKFVCIKLDSIKFPIKTFQRIQKKYEL